MKDAAAETLAGGQRADVPPRLVPALPVGRESLPGIRRASPYLRHDEVALGSQAAIDGRDLEGIDCVIGSGPSQSAQILGQRLLRAEARNIHVVAGRVRDRRGLLTLAESGARAAFAYFTPDASG
jgi:hypothetical protein